MILISQIEASQLMRGRTSSLFSRHKPSPKSCDTASYGVERRAETRVGYVMSLITTMSNPEMGDWRSAFTLSEGEK